MQLANERLGCRPRNRRGEICAHGIASSGLNDAIPVPCRDEWID
jgi:hypothetical protein